MPQRHDNLIGRICAFDNLLASAKAALCGKRGKPGPAAFQAELEKHILDLEERLRDGRWFPGPYRSFEVREPKVRMISAASFADRVVHHAVCRVVAPIFERGFIADSYANRIGKGTHRAVNRYEHYRDRHRFVLRCDVFRYFPAIDHAILKADLRRRIVCEPTLEILDRIIDGANPQEPVNLLFSGDDLFSPLCRRRGLPIGNLTSQFFANVYLDGLDHFVKEALRAPYLRYVDDFALFHNDCDVLEDWRLSIVRYLEGRRLVLHPRKTVIMATEMPVRFLGYELRRGGWRRLPAENVDRFAGRLRALRQRYQAGTADLPEARRRISSWIAHAAHAHTWRLRYTLFRGGMFDPAAGAWTAPKRVLRGGSWNNKPQNVRSANRNRNTTGNRNNNNGFRLASTPQLPEPAASRSGRVCTAASRAVQESAVTLPGHAADTNRGARAGSNNE